MFIYKYCTGIGLYFRLIDSLFYIYKISLIVRSDKLVTYHHLLWIHLISLFIFAYFVDTHVPENHENKKTVKKALTLWGLSQQLSSACSGRNAPRAQRGKQLTWAIYMYFLKVSSTIFIQTHNRKSKNE